MTDALDKLIEAVEAGENWPPLYGHSDLYDRIADALGTRDWAAVERVTKAYHGSLDAAHALHKAVLPGWRVGGLAQGDGGRWYITLLDPDDRAAGSWQQPAPARAWLLAILRAMKESEPPA